jgi:HK97 family phage portal protein
MIASALSQTNSRSQLANPPDWLRRLFGAPLSGCGVEVNDITALDSTGVFACNRILCESVAMLPLPIYRRDTEDPRRKTVARDHPLYRVLHDAPNPEMTAFEFREFMQGQLNIRGNAYAEIERDGRGNVVALWPLYAHAMTIERRGPKMVKVYVYRDGVVNMEFLERDIFHLRGFSRDGLMGIVTVQQAREAIGLDLSMQEYQAKFYRDGATLGGVIERPADVDWSDDARKQFAESIRQRFSGNANAHRVMVLEDGMTWKASGISPKDAQMIAGRQFSLADLSRVWGIPLPFLSDLSNAHFNNVEAMRLQFYTQSLAALYKRWEQRINESLLLPRERPEYFAEFVVEGLLRGDTASRYNAYSLGIQNGFLTRNEVRARENLDPIDGGDEALVPLNMAPSSELGDTEDIRATPRKGFATREGYAKAKRSAFARTRLRKQWEPVLRDALARMVRAEVREVKKIIGATLRADVDFLDELRTFYGEAFADIFDKAARAAFEAYAMASATATADGLDAPVPDVSKFVADYIAGFVGNYSAFHRNQLDLLLREADAAAIEDRLAEWSENEAEKVTQSEVVRIGEALAVAVFASMGVDRMVWIASPDACPICQEMDGKIASVSGAFLQAGETVEGDQTQTPITVNKTFRNPPLHTGCSCSVGAE